MYFNTATTEAPSSIKCISPTSPVFVFNCRTYLQQPDSTCRRRRHLPPEPHSTHAKAIGERYKFSRAPSGIFEGKSLAINRTSQENVLTATRSSYIAAEKQEVNSASRRSPPSVNKGVKRRRRQRRTVSHPKLIKITLLGNRNLWNLFGRQQRRFLIYVPELDGFFFFYLLPYCSTSVSYILKSSYIVLRTTRKTPLSSSSRHHRSFLWNRIDLGSEILWMKWKQINFGQSVIYFRLRDSQTPHTQSADGTQLRQQSTSHQSIHSAHWILFTKKENNEKLERSPRLNMSYNTRSFPLSIHSTKHIPRIIANSLAPPRSHD